jgi:arsenate reductase
MSAHWGVEDPAAVDGSDAQIAAAFAETYRQMNNRISAFINLPLESIDRMSLTNRLKNIGETGGEA